MNIKLYGLLIILLSVDLKVNTNCQRLNNFIRHQTSDTYDMTSAMTPILTCNLPSSLDDIFPPPLKPAPSSLFP